MNNDYLLNKDPSEVPKVFGSDGTWLAFYHDPKGNGTEWMAEISAQGKRSRVILKYDALDAYIYGLESLKQELELQRLKNGT